MIGNPGQGRHGTPAQATALARAQCLAAGRIPYSTRLPTMRAPLPVRSTRKK